MSQMRTQILNKQLQNHFSWNGDTLAPQQWTERLDRLLWKCRTHMKGQMAKTCLGTIRTRIRGSSPWVGKGSTHSLGQPNHIYLYLTTQKYRKKPLNRQRPCSHVPKFKSKAPRLQLPLCCMPSPTLSTLPNKQSSWEQGREAINPKQNNDPFIIPPFPFLWVLAFV